MPHRTKLDKQVKASKKYKINRPNMLNELRYKGAGLGIVRLDEEHPDSWYKYQSYAPEITEMADTLGYVHFSNAKEKRIFDAERQERIRKDLGLLNEERVKAKQKPFKTVNAITPLAWAILGALWAILIAVLVCYILKAVIL